MPCTCTQKCCVSVLKVRLQWFEADLVIFHGIKTCYISNEGSLVSINTDMMTFIFQIISTIISIFNFYLLNQIF